MLCVSAKKYSGGEQSHFSRKTGAKPQSAPIKNCLGLRRCRFLCSFFFVSLPPRNRLPVPLFGFSHQPIVDTLFSVVVWEGEEGVRSTVPQW